MTGHDDSRELFDAIVRRHEGTIKKIGALFYMPGSYHYDELVCDLTTYLWLVFYNLPRGIVISHEHAWVYSILYRKALNIIRDEDRRQAHFDYTANLTNHANPDDTEDLYSKLYKLISHLDDYDQELIMMYIDHNSVKDIAAIMGKSYLHTLRRINKIKTKLHQLNKKYEL